MNPDFFAVDRQSLTGHGGGAEKGLYADEASAFHAGHRNLKAKGDRSSRSTERTQYANE